MCTSRSQNDTESSVYEGEHIFPTVIDLFAKDLQAIGWWSRVLWDRFCSLIAPSLISFPGASSDSPVGSSRRPSTRSSVHDIPDDLRTAMQTMTLEDEVSNYQDRTLQLPMEQTEQPNFDDMWPVINDVAARVRPVMARRSTQISSSPLALEVLPESTDENDDSTLPRAQPSPTIETEHQAQQFTVDATLPIPTDSHVGGTGANSPPTSRSSSREHSTSRADRIEISTITTPNGDTTLQFSIPVDIDDPAAARGFRVPSSTSLSNSNEGSDAGSEEHFGFGISLRDFPARALVDMLSSQVTQLILWPVEALLVRNIALGFGPPGSWRNDLIHPPFRPWLGWPIFFKHTRTTILICGMPVVVGLALWQLEYQVVKLCGRRRHQWSIGK